MSSRSSGSNRGPIIAGAVAVGIVVLIAVVVVLASGGDDNLGGSGGSSIGEARQENGPVQVEGDALPAYPRDASGVIFGSADPAFGKRIPTVTGQSFDGSEVTISAEDGAQAIMIVAHWCPHCQTEVPNVVKWLRAEPLPEGVSLAAVSSAVDSKRPNYPPSRWMANEGWSNPVMADSTDYSAYEAFGGGGFPYFVFVDADGEVVSRSAGSLDERTFRAQIASIAP